MESPRGMSKEKWEVVNGKTKKNFYELKHTKQTLRKKQYSQHIPAANRVSAKNFQEICFLRVRKKV